MKLATHRLILRPPEEGDFDAWALMEADETSADRNIWAPICIGVEQEMRGMTGPITADLRG